MGNFVNSMQNFAKLSQLGNHLWRFIPPILCYCQPRSYDRITEDRLCGFWGGRLEALKYDNVNWNRCEVARVWTNGFLHQVPCTMTRAQHKSKGECFLPTHLSKLNPQPSSILQVSLTMHWIVTLKKVWSSVNGPHYSTAKKDCLKLCHGVKFLPL